MEVSSGTSSSPREDKASDDTRFNDLTKMHKILRKFKKFYEIQTKVVSVVIMFKVLKNLLKCPQNLLAFHRVSQIFLRSVKINGSARLTNLPSSAAAETEFFQKAIEFEQGFEWT